MERNNSHKGNKSRLLPVYGAKISFTKTSKGEYLLERGSGNIKASSFFRAKIDKEKRI